MLKVVLTLNLPTLLTILGGIVTVVFAVGRLVERVEGLDRRITAHVVLDEARAARTDERLSALATLRAAGAKQ